MFQTVEFTLYQLLHTASMMIPFLMIDLKDDVSIFVCEDLTLENETVRNVSPDQLDEIEFGSRAVILIVKKEML